MGAGVLTNSIQTADDRGEVDERLLRRVRAEWNVLAHSGGEQAAVRTVEVRRLQSSAFLFMHFATSECGRKKGWGHSCPRGFRRDVA